MANSVPILPPVTLGTGSQAVQAVGRCKDNGGNSFIGRLVVPGNFSYVEIFKRDSAGTVTKIDEFSMEVGPWDGHPEGHPRKTVDLHCMIDGPNVVSTVTGYNLTSPERDHYQEEHVTHNVAVPFPQGVNPESGAGPLMFYEPEGGSGGGGGADVDYDEVERRVRFVIEQQVRPFIEEWARTTIANIPSKAKIGVEQLFDGAQGSHVVYQQLTNTSYTGALGAIRDSDKPEEGPEP